MAAILSLIIVIVDQIAKFIITRCADKLPVDILNGIFSINLVYNKGGAFGILQHQNYLFILISSIAILIILLILPRQEINTIKIALSFIMGGAIGNMIDRVRLGCVIDFLDFKIWPVFNIADSAITIGAVLLVLQLLKSKVSASTTQKRNSWRIRRSAMRKGGKNQKYKLKVKSCL